MGSEWVADFSEIQGEIPNEAQVTVPERAVNPLRCSETTALHSTSYSSVSLSRHYTPGRCKGRGKGRGGLGFRKVSESVSGSPSSKNMGASSPTPFHRTTPKPNCKTNRGSGNNYLTDCYRAQDFPDALRDRNKSTGSESKL